MGATSDLHFRVHAAADVGHAPGGAGSDLSVGQRREYWPGHRSWSLQHTTTATAASQRGTLTHGVLGGPRTPRTRTRLTAHVQGHVSIYN